jgi:hypothetical protein
MFKSDATSTKFLAEQKALWTNTHKLSDILPRADEFDALFYVGGHGRMSSPKPKPYPLCITLPQQAQSNSTPQRFQQCST